MHPALSPVRGLYDANEEAKADADDEGVAEAKAEAKAEAVTPTIEDDDDDDEGVAEAKDDDPLTLDDEAAIYRVKEDAAPEEPAPSVGDLARRFGDTIPTRPRDDAVPDAPATGRRSPPPRPGAAAAAAPAARARRARGEQRLERPGGRVRERTGRARGASPRCRRPGRRTPRSRPSRLRGGRRRPGGRPGRPRRTRKPLYERTPRRCQTAHHRPTRLPLSRIMRIRLHPRRPKREGAHIRRTKPCSSD